MSKRVHYCDDDDDKMCNVSGYLILEKSSRKAFPRLKLKSKKFEKLEDPVHVLTKC